MSQVYIVNEASYLELPTLKGHQLRKMTSFIPMTSATLSITYTMVTTIETQKSYDWSHDKQESSRILKLDLY